MTVNRGEVWWAAVPGLGNRPVLVVSAQSLNRVLTEVTVARITSVDRERAIPSFVTLEPGEVLPERSFVICHNLFTLPTGELRDHAGTLTADRSSRSRTRCGKRSTYRRAGAFTPVRF